MSFDRLIIDHINNKDTGNVFKKTSFTLAQMLLKRINRQRNQQSHW